MSNKTPPNTLEGELLEGTYLPNPELVTTGSNDLVLPEEVELKKHMMKDIFSTSTVCLADFLNDDGSYKPPHMWTKKQAKAVKNIKRYQGEIVEITLHDKLGLYDMMSKLSGFYTIKQEIRAEANSPPVSISFVSTESKKDEQ